MTDAVQRDVDSLRDIDHSPVGNVRFSGEGVMRRGYLSRTFLVVILLMLAPAFGCKKGHRDAGLKKDAYKSPYLPADAVITPPATAASKKPEAVVEPPPSRFHPASKDREYPLLDSAEISTRSSDTAILELMSDPKKGGTALEKVRKAGAAGKKLVRKALRSRNDTIRKQACLILANMKDRSAPTVSALMDAVLLDPEPEVRTIAAKSFVAIKASSAAPTLVRSLLEDPHAPARESAARALGYTGGKGAVPALKKALGDPDTWVRLRAVSALKKRRAKNAVPDLIRMLDDPNRMVRARTREVLKTLTGVDKGDSSSDWK